MEFSPLTQADVVRRADVERASHIDRSTGAEDPAGRIDQEQVGRAKLGGLNRAVDLRYRSANHAPEDVRDRHRARDAGVVEVRDGARADGELPEAMEQVGANLPPTGDVVLVGVG